ncbi:uncharacterized protein G2W53_004936 [Senna tora]|uniref:Uncharacterized protein n=1 Tax=Senna tora TaxID=362788 RepID=A0A834XG58_9FABA|nr:uncharacterized protein G2W53_004936 [Senna tora]
MAMAWKCTRMYIMLPIFIREWSNNEGYMSF